MVCLAPWSEQHAPTGYEPNLVQNESVAHCMSIADSDDAGLMGIENSQLGQAPSSLSLENHGVPELPQGLRYRTRHTMHDVSEYCRNHSYSALQYQQEQLEKCCSRTSTGGL